MTPSEFKEIQKELGFSNSQMSEELCVDISTVEYWRSGKRAIWPRTEKAVRLLVRVKEKEKNLSPYGQRG